MESKEMKKNAPEELDDNILDHVSGGFVEVTIAEEVGVICKTCNQLFTVKISEMYDDCPACRARKNKN